MQEGEREAFETILAELFGALDKPLTEAKRDGFWKGLAQMSIVEFSRCRDQLLADLSDGEPRKVFSVSDVWAAKRKLKARGPQTIAPQEVWDGDGWDSLASDHLRAYLTRRLKGKPKFYGEPASFHGMRNMSRNHHPNADASPEFVRAVGILVEAKKLWARDMREAEQEGSVPQDGGKVWFEDCMRSAEEVIAQKAAA